MNVHALLDRVTAAAGALALGRDRFFARSADSAPIADVTRRIELVPSPCRAPARGT